MLPESLLDHRIVKWKSGALRLSLWWGKVQSSVVGYVEEKRKRSGTCFRKSCRLYRKSQEMKERCRSCQGKLIASTTTEKVAEVVFDESLTVEMETPILKIEVNSDLGKAIKEQVLALRKEAVKEYRDVEMPLHLAPLFNTEAVMLTLHSLGHLLAKSLPFLFLSSARDVNVLGDRSPSNVREPSFLYVFDQCPDGNGGTETIYENLEQCAEKAFLFADSCDCSDVGCPKCLTTSDCPEGNQGLSKLMAKWMAQKFSRLILRR